MSPQGRVPVFATGHQQTAVRRTPDFRSCTTGMCCLAVIRRGLLVGAYRPEAAAHRGPLWGRAEATSASSGLRTAPPPSLSTWV